MIRYALFALCLLNTAQGFAQKALTLSDAVLKAYSTYYPERLKGLQWIEGTNTYSYVQDGNLMRGTIDAPATELLSVSDLNMSLNDTIGMKGFPSITWLSSNSFRFYYGGTWCTHDLETHVTTRVSLPATAENEDIEDASGNIAFTVDNDLYVQTAAGNGVRITADGTDGIVNGKSVHRQEYGIVKGTFWAPGGEHLAFYRMDERMVSPYYLEDISTKPSTFEKIRYPMAGDTSHHVTVGIHDVKNGTTLFLKTGSPEDQYLTNISWDSDGRYVHVVHLDRKTENLRLVRYDPNSGEPVATLLEEHDPKYLEPEHPADFLRTRKDEYIWQSPRDGWDHLYLYSVKSGRGRQLSKGTWALKNVIGCDSKESFALVEGTADIDPKDPVGATETHLYSVDLKIGKTTRLTTEAGTHHGQLSTDGSYVLDTWSSLSVPNRTVIRDATSGKVLRTLVDAADPYAGTTVGTVEMMTVPGEGGSVLNAQLIKPSNFDATRKYPVLIYVYNGPHVQLVTNSFFGGGYLWMREAAERGYLVWTVDGHGSDHRGRDFEQAVHRHLGELEVKDQMRALEALKQLPFVDSTRIAVHGWSFGGHMTTAMLTRHPGTFLVGVAGGPVMDWSLYEVMYCERYMDTPAENPEGYASTTLPLLAGELQDDLLVITGGKDDTVLPQHALEFLKACIDKGVPVEFFDYPGHGHNVRGKDRVHLMGKVLDHIDDRIHPVP